MTLKNLSVKNIIIVKKFFKWI